MSDTAIEVSMQSMNSVDVVSQSPPSIELTQVKPSSISVELATIGPKGETGSVGAEGPEGPEGKPGPNTIGGFGIQVQMLSVGDQLRFSGNYWENISQTSLTDGGNF